MRVASFNLLHGLSPDDGRVDPARLAAAVRSLDVDLLALQEVDRAQPRSGRLDLTAVAAAAMGAVDHRFLPALLGTPGGAWVRATDARPADGPAYGIALLSRLPVTSWRVVRLPWLRVPVPLRLPGRRLPAVVREEPRVALVAGVSSPAGPLIVAGTHLSFVPWWNARQLRSLVAAATASPGPLLLLGDLNLGVGKAESVSGLRSVAEHPTFPADAPTRQLDHVLTDAPLQAASSEARATGLSDHCALVVDLS
jgi:endonuclease/exonuclease/phosphatase family metal-dependent hydrolase